MSGKKQRREKRIPEPSPVAIAVAEIPTITRIPAPLAERRVDLAIAIGLAVAYFVILCATSNGIGFARDEGYYFSAATSYNQWFQDLPKAAHAGHFLDMFREPAVARYWKNNDLHPPLVKILQGFAWQIFGKSGITSNAFAFRLPGPLSGAIILILAYFLALRAYGRLAAIVACALYALGPRAFFHSHLAAFVIPVIAGWMAIAAHFLWVTEGGEERGAIAWKTLIASLLRTARWKLR